MMDAHDTNQPLNQGELEEEKKTVEVSEAITETPAEDVTAEVQPEAYSHRMVERGNIVDVIEYGEILVDKVYAGYVLDKRDTSLR